MIGLLIAALGGTAVGLERQWSGHADGPDARFGGIRTFTMLGALGGLSGWLWTLGFPVHAGILLAGAALVIVAAYTAASRDDVDATTEVAALVVIAAGVIAGIGDYQVASAIIALQSLLLVEKSRLHAFVRRIDDDELRGAIHFGVLALVVLPLMPVGPYGPFGGIRPRELWALVLFFSGLSFIGYLARRLVTPEQGYLATGFLGGLVSSTNVTWTFARLSRSEPALTTGLAGGAIAANAVLFPRVLMAATILSPSLLVPLLFYLALPALAAGALAALATRRQSEAGVRPSERRNPLQVRAALQMAALFQAVLMLVHVTSNVWGHSGLLTSAAALGLTDVDALTMSMSRSISDTVPVEIAAMAIAVGVLTNTLLKLGVSIVFGNRRFALSAGGALAFLAAVLGLTILIQR
ncbi:MAG: DUF4010 domain-containing protein [Acidobacteria bacterium]|nr:MAG: DUF4010 domain-containing protein [Acidobacteriota bacterium]